MRLPDLLSGPAPDLLTTATDLFGGHVTSTVRLGVTGLSRAGKTVFITSLVRCLTEPQLAHPKLAVIARLPGFKAYLEPQPDDALPRFDYERHLASLTGAEREWPESTRRISQLRLTLEWDGETGATAALGFTRRLHIDIVDYPGEWLLDLSLMDQDFAAWSDTTRTRLSTHHEQQAQSFFAFLDETKGKPVDERTAIDGARLFTDTLHAIRDHTETQAVLGPGRFLLPGDLEGAPLLTFYPAPTDAEAGMPTLLAQRYHAYKRTVVEPFFRDHFARLDRQIILVDALTPLNRGTAALLELERALEDALKAFRPGRNTWASFLGGRRITRILFAATKADHIHAASHGRLSALLEHAVKRAAQRAGGAGANVGFQAMAALSATDNIDARHGSEQYHCIRGTPVAGEVVGARCYDGDTSAVVFPGDLPADPLDAFDPDTGNDRDYAFLRFRPPEIADMTANTSELDQSSNWPHIGLDNAVQFLLGEDLR